MATIRQAIDSALAPFGVHLNEVDADVLLTDVGIPDGNLPYEASVALLVKTAIHTALTERPSTKRVSEGDLTIDYDSTAIATYLAKLTADLFPETVTRPTVKDASNRW